MLGNVRVHEQAPRHEFADLLQDVHYQANQREVLSPQQQWLYRSRYAWARPFSTEPVPSFGFQMAYKTGHWIGSILTSPLCQLSLDGHHSIFTSTDLWQPVLSLSPQNLISALTLLFSTSVLVNSDSLQWPYLLATEMETFWCCICKFLSYLRI